MKKIYNKVCNFLNGGVPLSYLISHFFRLKVLNKIFGILKTGRFFSIHPSSIIKCSTKLKAGKNFVIGRNVYIDALSTDGVIFGDGCSVGMNTVIQCTSLLNSLGKGLRVGNNTGLGTHSFYGCAGGGIFGR